MGSGDILDLLPDHSFIKLFGQDGGFGQFYHV
jgi:hypothetical protein